METWFIDHKETLSGIADLTTALALLGVVFGVYQFWRGIRTTRANAIYEIQKDARDLAARLAGDPSTATDVPGTGPDARGRERMAWGQIFNFYSAVFQQRRLGVIDEPIWSQFDRELGRELQGDIEIPCEVWARFRDAYEPAYAEYIDTLFRASHKNEGSDAGNL